MVHDVVHLICKVDLKHLRHALCAILHATPQNPEPLNPELVSMTPETFYAQYFLLPTIRS